MCRFGRCFCRKLPCVFDGNSVGVGFTLPVRMAVPRIEVCCFLGCPMNKRLYRRPAGLLLAVSLFSLTGCAFDREWQSACSYSYPEHELAGCWEGTWQSDFNGHHGGLRAILTKEGDGYYNAHFHATYAVVIPFEFEIPLLVTDDGHVYEFTGEADLGWLAGGNYVYTGTATSMEFQAHYEAENCDHGTFTMTKVHTCSDSCGANCSASAVCGPSVNRRGD